MLLISDIRLNLFGLEIQYHFDLVVYICLEKSYLHLLWWSSKTVNSSSGNLGCSFKGLQGILSLMYNVKRRPNRFRSHLNCLNRTIQNWFNSNVQSNFDSEIKKISKVLIIFSTKTNLFLIELIFRWPVIVFKALSVLFLWIRTMSLFIEKHDSEFSADREP